MSTQNIAIIILAAGSSSRLGQSKQLLSVNGEPLLLTSLNAAIGTGIENIVAVLGDNASAHRKLIEYRNIQIVENHNWKNGMGSSLKVGLRYLLQASPSLEAVIVMVCDQPLITSAHLEKLLSTHQSKGSVIVASVYGGVVGVPVLFHHSYFQELLAVADDSGAKKILFKHSASIHTIEFKGGEIDIDTQSDLEDFLRR